jgi:hypothetical protein
MPLFVSEIMDTVELLDDITDELEDVAELEDVVELEDGRVTLCSYSVVLIFPTPAQVVTVVLTFPTASAV